MKLEIKTLTFQEVYPTGSQYLNQRLGMEISYVEGQDPLEIYKEAKRITDEAHKAMYPQLYEWTITASPKQPKLSIEDQLIQDMNACTEIDEVNLLGVQIGLVGFSNGVKGNPILEDAYEKKYNQLLNKQ